VPPTPALERGHALDNPLFRQIDADLAPFKSGILEGMVEQVIGSIFAPRFGSITRDSHRCKGAGSSAKDWGRGALSISVRPRHGWAKGDRATFVSQHTQAGGFPGALQLRGMPNYVQHFSKQCSNNNSRYSI
jgi:hypothetical protein